MAVDVQLMGDRAGVERLLAALNGPLEIALNTRKYSLRGVPEGVRRFGEARPRAAQPGTAVELRDAVLALPPAAAAEPSVRLRLAGDEAEVLAVLLAARDLLHLAYPPRDFPRNGGFGRSFYLHIYTGHLPEPASTTTVATVVATPEDGRRGRRWTASERADRGRLAGRSALPRRPK